VPSEGEREITEAFERADARTRAYSRV
jgi:hypothetical protein